MKFTTETIHSVEYSDLEAAIQDEFGLEVSIVAALESANDVSHREYVNDDERDKWAEESWQKLLAGGAAGFDAPGLFLNELARRGHIPTGLYVIDVSW